MLVRPLSSLPPVAVFRATRTPDEGTQDPKETLDLGATETRVQKPLPQAAPQGEIEPVPEKTPDLPVPTERKEAEAFGLGIRTLYRRETMPVVATLTRQLRAGELEGEAFQQAARTLHNLTHGSPDPLTARAARLAYYDCFKYPEPVIDFTMKMGPVEGSLYALDQRASTINGWYKDRYYISEESITPFVDALWEATADAPPSAAAVSTMTRLAHGFYKRATQELPEELRAKESPEDDLRWARQCVGVLEGWRAEGALSVYPGGPLEELLQQRRPALRGTTLDFSELPRPDETEARPVLEGIPSWKNDPAPGLARLEALEPERAALVAAQIADLALHPQTSDETIPSLTRILNEGSPATVKLFAPHAARLSKLVTELEPHGPIAANNLHGQARASFYIALVDKFPEVVDDSLLRDQLEPLYYAEINTANALRPLITKIWDSRPELVVESMDRALDRPSAFYPDHLAKDLVGEAIEHGWNPSPLQKDWLVSWLYVPADKEDRILAHNQTFDWALKTVNALEERSPGFLEGLQLPDTQGVVRPLGSALLDRLLNDPDDEAIFRFYAPGSHMRTWSPVKTIYNLAFPDDQVTEELLTKVEAGYRRSGSVGQMTRDEKVALVVLASAELPEEADRRLCTLLTPERYRDQGPYVFNEIVDKYRRGFQEQALATVGSPQASTPERLEAAREFLKLGLDRVSRWDLDRYYDRLAEPLQKTFGDEEFAQVLASGVRGGLASPDLAKMDSTHLADLVLARTMARTNPELEQRFKAEVKPLLSHPIDYHEAVRHLLDPLRDEALEALTTRLAAGEGAQKDRLDLLEDGFAMAARSYGADQHREALVKAWKEGTTESWPSQVVSQYRDPWRAAEAVRAIFAEGEHADRFQTVWDQLGGERYHGDVLTAFQTFSRALDQGTPRDLALEQALKGYLAETAAGPVGDIQLDDDQVVVGDISLAVQG